MIDFAFNFAIITGIDRRLPPTFLSIAFSRRKKNGWHNHFLYDILKMFTRITCVFICFVAFEIEFANKIDRVSFVRSLAKFNVHAKKDLAA